jgi:putative tryptophan/tyrosine transport system substrate-binding protein
VHRRGFIAGLGATVSWPMTARAQRPGMPVVGYLQAGSAEKTQAIIVAFRRGLAESGFVEGQNVVVEYRLANNQPDRVPALAAELVSLGVRVLASGYQTARAAKDTTTTIPIVFMGGADPVRVGLVDSVNRPGGNVNGVSLASTDLLGKRVALLRELVRQLATLGVLVDATGPEFELQLQDVQEAGRRLGLSVVAANVRSERDFEDAFSTFGRQLAGAVIVAPSTLFNDNPDRLAALAARHGLPTASGTAGRSSGGYRRR